MQHVLVVACSCVVRSLLSDYQSVILSHCSWTGLNISYERFLILSVFIFSPLMTGDGSEILSQQKDVARPEFELTSTFKKSTEVGVRRPNR